MIMAEESFGMGSLMGPRAPGTPPSLHFILVEIRLLMWLQQSCGAQVAAIAGIFERIMDWNGRYEKSENTLFFAIYGGRRVDITITRSPLFEHQGTH